MTARRCAAKLFLPATAMAVLGLSAAACSSSGSSTTPVQGGALSPTPLATSLESAGATWATIPMGNLDQPLNTFWQLFELPQGATGWSNQVQSTGVATNGGIVLASSPGGTVVAAVRPSNMLTYSPAAVTDDAGRSWSTSLVDAGLADHPDTLALGSDDAFALAAGGDGGEQLLEGGAALGDWHRVVDQQALADTAAGRACGVVSLVAVADVSGSAVVGAACSTPGTVGVLSDGPGGWRLAGPRLPASLARRPAEVLGLWPVDGGLDTLVAVSGGTGQEADLVEASSAGAGQWTVSSPSAIPDGDAMASFGPTASGGVFVLATGPRGDLLETDSGAGTGWTVLPAPPGGTQTVAFPAGGPAYAMAGDGTVLKVWSLAAGWSLIQTTDVPIQFGSSS